MNILNRKTIKARILVLVLIPILVIGALILDKYMQVSHEKNTLEALSHQIQLAYVAGDLLTDAQTERTLAQLVSGGDKKFLSADKYLQSYKDLAVEADKSVDNLKNFSSLYEKSLSLDIKKMLNELFDYYELVAITREGVFERKFVKIGKLDGYSLIMQWPQRIIDLINQIEILSASNETLSLLSQAYSSVVQISQNYTIFQGAVMRTLDMKALDFKRYGNISMTSQNSKKDMERFMRYASPELGEYFLSEYWLSPDHEEFTNFVRKVRARAGKKLEYKTEYVFNLTNANLREVKRIERYVAALIENETKRLLEQANNAVFNIILLLVVVSSLIGFISIVIIRSITNPLKIMVKTFNQVAANKDVSKQLDIKGKDELSDVMRALNLLLSSFNKALTGVKSQTQFLNTVTDSVSISMDENLKSVSSQKLSTDSITVAIEQMTVTIDEVSNTTHKTSDAVQRAHDTSIKSTERAEETKNIMLQLISELNNSADRVNELNAESESIGAVLNVIQAIAEQINLLALNAAIEAARAGEHGRGFAVVADEVRGLAKRTQDSTKDIQFKIESLQSGATETRLSMENLQNNGKEAIQAVIDSVDDVAILRGELDNISHMATQIATASEEQSFVANDINKQIHTISDDADKMADQVNQTVSASDSLVKSSQTLNGLVGEFKI